MKTTFLSFRHLRLTILATLLFANPTVRAQYSFTLIADSTSPTFGDFTISSNAPSINAAGTVAFQAYLDGSFEQGIFTGAGGDTTTIALGTGPTVDFFGRPSINLEGTVAFYATRDMGGHGIFTGAGGMLTTIALNDEPFRSLDGPVITAAGTVAFRAGIADAAGGSGTFTATGGAITTLVRSSDSVFETLTDVPAINAAGTVAFWATLDAGGQGIFISAGGATTAIALTSGPIFDFFGDEPSINAAGTVAFAAFLDARGYGIFTGAGGPTTTVALSSGPFSFLDNPAINAAGTVAFTGVLDGGGEGLYVGDGGAGTRVIGTGDVLFGSTVRDFQFGPSGLNDLGQLAFSYTLANGTTGIAVATLPEPGSASLVLLGALGLAARRRRAR